jgi:oxygen-independent coproporphyrinogen III oxidase
MSGVYIHVPFCKQACHYCDFHFSTQQGGRTEFVRAIAEELRLQKNYLGNKELKTIYFGGGTPSLLNQEELSIIFDAIRASYKIADDPEITLEANPDDLSGEKLVALTLAGINRLSIGIQSFDDPTLKFLNRAHSALDALQCFQNAREAGFANISIDLMYAIPGQTPENWKKDLEQAILLSPDHISAYSLTLEEKTAFGKWQHSGKLRAVDEESAAHQFELSMDMLGEAGYEHYEISNFCKPGAYSRHNSGYWKQKTYLGVGPSGHSFNGESRQFNVANNAHYLNSIRESKVPAVHEVLSPGNKINEYIFTTLRTRWGCNLRKIEEDFHIDLMKGNREYLADLVKKNLLTIENDVLILTRPGKLFADKIASDLFVDAGMDS